MNLAIKHRPRNYDEVVGNTKVITELKNRAKNNSFAKVVLFTGISGIGKSSLQFIYIKTLLCENLTDSGNPCNSCVYCKTVDKGENTDYLKFYDGGSFGVAEADNVIDFTRKKILGKPNIKKIIVLDELQSIKSKSAEEKLLKVLEKENDNCYYVLGAMRWEQLGKALKRRSTKYHLTLELPDIGDYLKKICDLENFKVEQTELIKILWTIANYCNGSLGVAVSILERVIYSEIKTEAEMIKELDILPDKILKEIINGMIEGDISVMNKEITEDTLNQIEFKLNILYRSLAGIKLNSWQKSNIEGITGKVNIENVTNIIEKFFELRKYPYKDKTLIEYILIGVILENQKLSKTKLEEKPVRPTRPTRQLRG